MKIELKTIVAVLLIGLIVCCAVTLFFTTDADAQSINQRKWLLEYEQVDNMGYPTPAEEPDMGYPTPAEEPTAKLKKKAPRPTPTLAEYTPYQTPTQGANP